jgi:peptidoglycan/xylan/chitin deacetylase (PgdA/CDA1 family)
MTTCYLTIDDSPSPHTDEMIDFLIERKIPALLFCRGDFIEQNPAPIIRAIKHGFVIGNHSYSHKPFGDLSYSDAVADIEKCETLIDQCYTAANIPKHGNYFRFPYLDRGNGDRIERHFENVSDININADDKVQALQDYLKNKAYAQPFQTNHPLYKNHSIANATDCLMTYTSFDWMLTERHKGKWDYKSIEDLKKRIDNDALMAQSKGNILIFHDQPEILPVFKSLIDHMVAKGYEFLPV